MQTQSNTRIPHRNKFFAILLRLLLPKALIEFLARIGGYVADVAFFDKGSFGEARIRAILTNLKYGFLAHAIGRGVIFEGASRIHLEQNVVLHHGVVLIAGTQGYCRIGQGSHVSHYTVLSGTHGISIGSDTAISSGVAIYSVSNQKLDGLLLTETPLRIGAVEIGSRVLIGANAMIMPGVVLEDDCAVGANAVVIRRVKAENVVVGVPAKPIRPTISS